MKNSKNQGLEKLDNSLKSIAKSSLIVLISLLLARLAGYLFRFVIARYLGPEAYGLYTLALIIVSLLIAISSFGIADGILRFIPLYRGKEEISKIRYLFRFSFIILTASSLIFGAILFFSSTFISLNIFHNPGLIIYLKFFSIFIPISILASLFLNILRAYEHVNWVSFLANILLHILKLGILIVLLIFSLKASAIALSCLISLFVILIIAYLLCQRKISTIFVKSRIKKDLKQEIRKSLFAYSWPILFISLAGSILYWIDSFSIGYFKSASDVGFYNAAVPLAAIFIITSEIFMQLFYPLITKEYAKKNFKLIKEISKQIGKWVFIINLPLFIIMFLFPGVIINVLFGQQYLAAENSLRILSFTMFFTSLVTISNTLLLMLGKSKVILKYLLLASAFNLILDILLVPKYNMLGAAFSTMLCQIILGIMIMRQVYKYTGILPLRRKMLGIFLISLIPLTIILIIKSYISINILSLILIGILFIGIYLLLIFLTKCFDKNDIMIIQAIKRKIFNKTAVSPADSNSDNKPV